MNPIAFCSYPNPLWFLISSNVPTLVYYSHVPVMILALLIGFYVLLKNRKVLANQILFFVLSVFSIWVFLDSVFWAANRSDVVMFVWSLQILVEPLIHIGALYLVYVLITKRDVPFWAKISTVVIYLPIILFTPTGFSLEGFNTTDCLAIEHPYSYYTYLIEGLFSFLVVCVAGIQLHRIKDNTKRKEILLLSSGIVLFLLSFSWGAIVGSFTDNWGLAQYGLFGMPIFGALLAYTIVKFQTFNIRLIGAQALVAALAIITGSQFFFIRTSTNFVLNSASFVLIIVFGYFLIKSVKREIEQRERIERLASDLQKTNTQLAEANSKLKELDKQKSEFVSFASHQLRSPMTAMKGYISLMFEGEYGKIPDNLQQPLKVVLESTNTLINIVEDYLNISRIELGSMRYSTAPMDWKELTEQVVSEQKPNVEARGLRFITHIQGNEKFIVLADKDKFKQILVNLIDNAVKYTQKGSVTVELKKVPERKVIQFIVTDTGIGIPKDILPKLFRKWSRADNAKTENIKGTGLGLFVAKQITEAHKGRVWVESEGENKGSRFIVELPEA